MLFKLEKTKFKKIGEINLKIDVHDAYAMVNTFPSNDADEFKFTNHRLLFIAVKLFEMLNKSFILTNIKIICNTGNK